MKSITRLLSLVALLSVIACGCSSNENNDTITEQSFPNFFANVREFTSGATAVYSNIAYKVTLNYTAQTSDIQISGLKLPDGTTYPTMTLRNLRWGINSDGWKVISGTNVSPAISGFGNPPVFTRFEFRIYERFLEAEGNISAYSPGACATFTINGLYNVLSSYTPQVLYGETTCEDTATDQKFTSEAVEYVVTYNVDTRMISLLMNGIKFKSSSSDKFDLELRNIPVEVSNDGMSFKVDAAVPYLSGTPFESVAFSDIKGVFNPGKGLDMTFSASPRNSSTSYDFTVECDYSKANTAN